MSEPTSPEAYAEARWQLTEQDYQRTPEGDWRTWLFMAGRGSGKTFTGSNFVRRQVLRHPGREGGVIARTYRDLVDTCLEGPSGLLRILPAGTFEYRPSKQAIYCANGATIHLYSAEKPQSMRGPNLAWAWCDELAAWDDIEPVWEQLMMATRVGDPRIFISTTPQPKDRVLALVEDAEKGASVRLTTANSYQNRFLSSSWKEFIQGAYEGTRLGRQEIYAELLTDVPGALWTYTLVDGCYRDEVPALTRIVIGVDPSGGRAETGIVVAGVDRQKRGWVLADLSTGGGPEVWSNVIVDAYRTWGADRVVVEKNFGGDMCEHTLKTVDQHLPIKTVSASRGKIPRAEPVANLYQQGKVFHAGRFAELAKQMCTYTPEDKTSPDRMDALVWALSELMVSGHVVDLSAGPGGVGKTSAFR